MDNQNYLDITGLSYYDDKLKEYIKQNFLLRKNYDCLSSTGVDSSISGNVSYDETKGAWKFSGVTTITLPREASIYGYISITDKSPDAEIIIGATHYSNNYVFFRTESSSTVTITFNGDFWLTYIKFEELTYKIPTKTSELENDSKFVTADVSGSTLIINDGTIKL